MEVSEMASRLPDPRQYLQQMLRRSQGKMAVEVGRPQMGMSVEVGTPQFQTAQVQVGTPFHSMKSGSEEATLEDLAQVRTRSKAERAFFAKERRLQAKHAAKMAARREAAVRRQAKVLREQIKITKDPALRAGLQQALVELQAEFRPRYRQLASAGRGGKGAM